MFLRVRLLRMVRVILASLGARDCCLGPPVHSFGNILHCCVVFGLPFSLICHAASAHDDDTSHGDVVTHTLLPIQDYTAFTLGPTSGLLRNVYQLDYEFKRGYNVTVRANDKQGHSIQYRIQILVQNINEVGVACLLRESLSTIYVWGSPRLLRAPPPHEPLPPSRRPW